MPCRPPLPGSPPACSAHMRHECESSVAKGGRRMRCRGGRLAAPQAALAEAFKAHTERLTAAQAALAEAFRACLLYTSDAADDTPC
eukprot:4571011-Pyramimonas_sp.AAC.1